MFQEGNVRVALARTHPLICFDFFIFYFGEFFFFFFFFFFGVKFEGDSTERERTERREREEREKQRKRERKEREKERERKRKNTSYIIMIKAFSHPSSTIRRFSSHRRGGGNAAALLTTPPTLNIGIHAQQHQHQHQYQHQHQQHHQTDDQNVSKTKRRNNINSNKNNTAGGRSVMKNNSKDYFGSTTNRNDNIQSVRSVRVTAPKRGGDGERETRREGDEELEAKDRLFPPDLPGFVMALQDRDRVAAWLKFKDLMLSPSSSSSSLPPSPSFNSFSVDNSSTVAVNGDGGDSVVEDSTSTIIITSSQVSSLFSLLLDHHPPKISLMLQALEWIKEKTPSVLTTEIFNLVLEACVKCLDLKTAWNILREMQTSSALLSLPSMNKSNSESAQPTFLRTKSSNFTSSTDTSSPVESSSIPSSTLKIMCDISTYNHVLDLVCKMKGLQSGQEFYEAMLKEGMSPNVKTLTNLIKVNKTLLSYYLISTLLLK
jgi:hypothetical protein